MNKPTESGYFWVTDKTNKEPYIIEINKEIGLVYLGLGGCLYSEYNIKPEDLKKPEYKSRSILYDYDRKWKKIEYPEMMS
jgi:hypothetical protein